MNGYTILIVVAIVALYYYIGYQHGKSEGRKQVSEEFYKDLKETNDRYREWQKAHK